MAHDFDLHIETRISPEINPQEKLFDTVRKVTLSDGYTMPYKDARLQLVTLSSEELANLGAISVYALKDRLEKHDHLDNLCREEFGLPVNEIDSLYHFYDHKIITPPIVELYSEANTSHRDSLNQQNTTIIDGHHRIISCIEKHQPLTVLTISKINESFRLPFVSFSPLDIAVVDDVPEKKRIVSDPSLSDEKIQKLYRNLGQLGSNIRDQTYTLQPLLAWELHQIKREPRELKQWLKLTQELEPYVPPLPSILNRPFLRIIIDGGSILNMDTIFDSVENIQPTNYDPYSLFSYISTKYRRDYPIGYPLMREWSGEGVLVKKEFWKNHCTKLVSIIPPDHHSGQLSNVSEVNLDSYLLTPCQVPINKEFMGEIKRITVIPSESPNDNNDNFLAVASTEILFSNISDLKTTVDTTPVSLPVMTNQNRVLLSLQSWNLFGINSYGVDTEYKLQYYDGGTIESSQISSGPTLLLEPDFLMLVKLDYRRPKDNFPDISNHFIHRFEQTQWYNEATNPKSWYGPISGPEQMAIENRINRNTIYLGEMNQNHFFDLVKSGHIPDSKSITSVFLSLLNSGQLVLDSSFADHSIILESKKTPFGIIFIPPNLSLDQAKTANSMKLPSYKNRMDMSFTLLQTNQEKLSQRTTTGDLVSINLAHLIKTLSTSTKNLPFDIESLSHIFSGLAQVGAIKFR